MIHSTQIRLHLSVSFTRFITQVNVSISLFLSFCRRAVEINVAGTKRVLDLCKKLHNFKVSLLFLAYDFHSAFSSSLIFFIILHIFLQLKS